MAANITSGNTQSYDSGEGVRIFQGIRPDVVMIQEFNDQDIDGMVREAFGSDFHYYRTPGSFHIPNGVISRWPIVESGDWDDSVVPDRMLTWARIDIPGDRDLWAVSVHLSTSSAANRNTEAKTLADAIRAKVPTRDYLVLGGDFNTKLRSEPAIGTLSSLFVTSGPYPADGHGNDKTNAARAKPYDWVLADADLNQHEVPVELGASTYSNGLVVDTRVYSPLGDITPAKAADSDATNMQHMAVVRDFSVPVQGGADTPPPPPGPTNTDDNQPPPPPQQTGEAKVMMSSILANEPGGDTGAEAITLTNVGNASADLSGWTLSDKQQTRHVFPQGTTLDAGASLTVYGRDCSTGTLSLNNGGDTVTLKDATGEREDQYVYANAGADGVALIREAARLGY